MQDVPCEQWSIHVYDDIQKLSQNSRKAPAGEVNAFAICSPASRPASPCGLTLYLSRCCLGSYIVTDIVAIIGVRPAWQAKLDEVELLRIHSKCLTLLAPQVILVLSGLRFAEGLHMDSAKIGGRVRAI